MRTARSELPAVLGAVTADALTLEGPIGSFSLTSIATQSHHRKGSGVHRRLSIPPSWDAGERPARQESTGLFQISASAVTSRSICSSECSGVGVSRRRSVPLSSDQFVRQSPAVLDNLFERLDLK